MDDEIQLISDGDGLAVIGDPTAVDRFLASEGLPSKDLGLQRLGSALGAGSSVAQAGSEIAANSGRWVKLTEESAQRVKKYALMKGSDAGVSRAVLTEHGKISGLLEIVTAPGALLTNPALLTGAAGLMAQLAMQQTMDEITDYLAVIDEKVDDVLRAQKDAVLADMIGVDFVIEEAMTIREHGGPGLRGHVVEGAGHAGDDRPHPGVRAASARRARGEDGAQDQGRRPRQDGQGGRVEGPGMARRAGPLLPTAGRDRRARTRPGAGRVSGRSGRASPRAPGRPAEPAGTHLAQHRAAAGPDGCGCRHGQHEGAAEPAPRPRPWCSRGTTSRPSSSTSTGGSASRRDRQSLDARRWPDAAAEVRDKVLETGAEGVDASRRLGNETFGRAKSVTGKLSSGIAERTLRRRGNDEKAEWNASDRPAGPGPVATDDGDRAASADDASTYATARPRGEPATRGQRAVPASRGGPDRCVPAGGTARRRQVVDVARAGRGPSPGPRRHHPRRPRRRTAALSTPPATPQDVHEPAHAASRHSSASDDSSSGGSTDASGRSGAGVGRAPRPTRSNSLCRLPRSSFTTSSRACR